MKYDALKVNKGKIEILDQRFLPEKMIYRECKNSSDIFDAISKMKIRGAPAIGIAGAFGMYLSAKGLKDGNNKDFMSGMKKSAAYLGSSRPTARNLFWAIERMEKILKENETLPAGQLTGLLYAEALSLLEEDKLICRKIGDNGRRLMPRGAKIITHCNAGALATGGYGTALGVIFSSRKKIKKVYVDETRPLLQGARLTAWELSSAGIPSTLMCDNAAAHIMARDGIDAVIVGADRIAANGDTANKIGTYQLAVSAFYHGVPFYVAAPVSTFDISLSDGKKIVIEERSAEEVKKINGKYITPEGMPAENPAFDITPSKLVKAIITEKGVIEKPFKKNIKKVLFSDG